jgi:hypothetical protein
MLRLCLAKMLALQRISNIRDALARQFVITHRHVQPVSALVRRARSALPDAPRSAMRESPDWAITVDHKRLGILYILYALLFLVIGGVEATIMRVQLITAHNHFVSPEVFNRMFTMHGTTMIFL